MLKQVLSWCYGTGSKKFFDDNILQINSYNVRILKTLDTVMAIVMAILSIVSFFVESYYDFRRLYLVLMIVFFVLSLILYAMQNSNEYRIVKILMQLSVLTIYIFTVLIGTFLDNDSPITAVAIFYTAIPMIFILPIHYVGSFALVSFICFAIADYIAKDFSLMLYDSIQVLVSMVIGIVIGHEILRSRVSHIADANRLKEANDLDGLTGVKNRRALNEHAAKNFPSNFGLAVIMFDIDNFKKFNDTYGHLNGDTVLIEVAQKLNSIAEDNNSFLGRYGGEEFLLISTGLRAQRINEVAEECLDGIRSLQIPFAESEYHFVTISAGYASTCNTNNLRNVEELIARADKALYQAKLGGRNRACQSKYS